jgi:hypothetical protein
MSERKRGVSVHVPGKEKHVRTVDRPHCCAGIRIGPQVGTHRSSSPTGPGAYTHLVPSDRGDFIFGEN